MTIATCVLGRLTGPLCDALLGITGSRAMVEEIELRQIFLHELSGERPLSMLTRDRVTVAVTTSWGGRAPATWNRQVATVRSFLGFCQGRRWLAEGIAIDLERRPEPSDSPLGRAGAAVAPQGRQGTGEGAVAAAWDGRPGERGLVDQRRGPPTNMYGSRRSRVWMPLIVSLGTAAGAPPQVVNHALTMTS